ncbi:hypothetical protein AVEN_168046-1 [Araneus ventricosus]|uniref:Uncharacterized protein n=1 Tax=Araneus ventricosus TaxID=182803 RepID=A0A4Y2JTC8_ARAVE|nr:hypothetical protein AVEN_168046-1 [Araneus ventricosus]
MVFEAPAEVFQKLELIQKIPIRWQMFRISEVFHIKRCNFSQSFGHTTKDYRFNIPSCANFAGHHHIKDCTPKQENKSLYKGWNIVSARMSSTGIASGHRMHQL